MARLGRVPVALALLLLALAAPGCSLVLDFDGELIDAAPPPVIDADPNQPDAPITPETLFEPNDTAAAATPITPGSFGPLAIKPVGDHDFFTFEVTGAPRDVTIDVLFVTAEGDLDVRLLDGSMVQIAESAGFADNEHIVRTMAMGGQLAPGTYYIDVFGFNNQRTNDSYMLVLTVSADPVSDAGP